jgi:FlaA1/EpsC-like NDP-sugar epimerase
MANQLTNYKFYLLILFDICFLSFSIALSYLFRFDFMIPSFYFDQMITLIYITVPFKVIVFYIFGLYRGMWRYTNFHDMWRILQACVAASMLVILLLLFWNRFLGYPRSVFVIDFVLSFLFCGGFRAIIRMFYIKKEGLKASMLLGFPLSSKRQRMNKVLIVGAGYAGEKLLREIVENPELEIVPVGFLDDDPAKGDRTIHGIRVLGTIDDLQRVLQEIKDITQVLIAIPTATGRQVRRIVDQCKDCGAEYKILPGLGEIVQGKVSISQLREVRYEDLLGREPVQLEIDSIKVPCQRQGRARDRSRGVDRLRAVQTARHL